MCQMQDPQVIVRQFIANSRKWAPACHAKLINFLDETISENKAKIAINAIQELINPHEKPDLPNTLQCLYHVEEMLRLGHNEGSHPFYEVQKRSRDHVIHALNTYLLGLLLIDKLDIRIPADFDFQWKLAALFHDIGYPLEIAKKIIDQSVINPLNDLFSPFNLNKKYNIRFSLQSFKTLTTKQKSLDLLQACFSEAWHLNVRAESLYISCRNDKVKHGVVSSLLLMAHIDYCYTKNNPNHTYEELRQGSRVFWPRMHFDKFIVPACAAIMLHDAHKTHFKHKRIRRDVAPLAWLLRVSDALQDWERPKSGYQNGTPSHEYRLGFQRDFIHFKCPAERINSIWNEDLGGIDAKENFIQISPL